EGRLLLPVQRGGQADVDSEIDMTFRTLVGAVTQADALVPFRADGEDLSGSLVRLGILLGLLARGIGPAVLVADVSVRVGGLTTASGDGHQSGRREERPGSSHGASCLYGHGLLHLPYQFCVPSYGRSWSARTAAGPVGSPARRHRRRPVLPR